MSQAQSASPGFGLFRSVYFFYYAGMAALFPFLPLYYGQLGLVGRQIGFLAGLPPALFLVGGSLWGAVADVSHRHKLVLLLAILAAAVTSQLVAATSTFAGLVLAVVGLSLCMAPIIPLVDHAVMERLGDRKDRYGRIRMWGAVGWLVERSGLGWSFRGYLLTMLACLLAALRLPVAHARLGGPFRRGLGVLLGDRRWLLFLFVAFAGGMGLAPIHHFLFLYMQGLGASQSAMGLALSCATLSELAVFMAADRLLRRWSLRRLLVLAMLVLAGRLLAYAAASAAWQVLLIQLLHGPTFALMWVAGVTGTNRLAPAGLGGTAQGLFAGVNFGLGGAAGGLFGGVLYEVFGGAGLYLGAAAWVLAALLVFALAGRRITF